MSGATYDTNNIFAKILRGEIPCHKVYEDADTLAFMDVMPQSKGHLLVVPKARRATFSMRTRLRWQRPFQLSRSLRMRQRTPSMQTVSASCNSTSRPPARPSITCISMSCRATKARASSRIPARWKIMACWRTMPSWSSRHFRADRAFHGIARLMQEHPPDEPEDDGYQGSRDHHYPRHFAEDLATRHLQRE